MYFSHAKYWKLLINTMKNIFIVAVGLLAISSCTDPQTKLSKQIEELRLSEKQNFETKQKLAQLQEEFIKNFSTDSLTISFNEEVANYYYQVDSFQKAIEYVDLYNSRYDSSGEKWNMTMLKARSLVNQQKYADGITVYEEILQNQSLPMLDVRLLGEAHQHFINDSNFAARDKHLFKLGGIKEQINELDSAMLIYSHLYTQYPNSKYGAFSMMKHSDLLEKSGEVEQSKSVLEKLIETYPDTQFAKDAKILLDENLLGQTPEEQLDYILNKKKLNN